MTSLGVGKVHKSKNLKFKEGAIVDAPLEWAEYTLITGATVGMVQVLENKYNIPWSAFTGVLGMPGFTAYSYLPRFSCWSPYFLSCVVSPLPEIPQR